jgi:hypothetical protein
VCYIILRRFNIFQINTAAYVNVRGAQTFAENPLARQSAGAVEVSLGAGGCWLPMVGVAASDAPGRQHAHTASTLLTTPAH